MEPLLLMIMILLMILWAPIIFANIRSKIRIMSKSVGFADSCIRARLQA